MSPLTANSYVTALGSTFLELAPNVQVAHAAPLRARGQVEVVGSDRPFVRLAANLVRLPKPGQQDVTLVVSQTTRGMQWIRTFGTRTFRSDQHFAPARMIERIGLAQFTFSLEVLNGSLHYTTIGFRFAGIPLPLAIAPKTVAVVFPTEKGWYVDVELSVPGLGVLCHYWGEMFAEATE